MEKNSFTKKISHSFGVGLVMASAITTPIVALGEQAHAETEKQPRSATGLYDKMPQKMPNAVETSKPLTEKVAWVNPQELPANDGFSPSVTKFTLIHTPWGFKNVNIDGRNSAEGWCLNPLKVTPLKTGGQKLGTDQVSKELQNLRWYYAEHDGWLDGANGDVNANTWALSMLVWHLSNTTDNREPQMPLDKIHWYDTPFAQKVKGIFERTLNVLSNYNSPGFQSFDYHLVPLNQGDIQSDGSMIYKFKVNVPEAYTTNNRASAKINVEGIDGYEITQDGKQLNNGDSIQFNKEFEIKVSPQSKASDMKIKVGGDYLDAPFAPYWSEDKKSQNYLAVPKAERKNWEDPATVAIPATSGKIKVHKTDERTNKPLSDVEFGLFDKDGNQVGETVKTDENGNAEFSNVPIGEYTIKEIKPKNEGYEENFNDYRVVLDIDSALKDGVLQEVVNIHKQPEVKSIMTGTKENGAIVDAKKSVETNDKVLAKFVRDGGKYRVKEQYYETTDTDRKNPITLEDGKTEVYSQEYDATSDTEEHVFEVNANLDLSGFKGKKVTAVPTLQWLNPEGEWEDVYTEDTGLKEDSGSQQVLTVTNPEITTLAHSNDNKVVNPYKEVPIVDNAKITSATPNKTYVAHGKLMVVGEDGKATPLEQNGKVVETSQDVTADENGNVTTDLDFGNIDTRDLKGKRLVVFEYLEDKETGEVISSEEDADNKDQTITVTNPKIKTLALVNGEHKTVTPDKDQRISDLVTIEGYVNNTPMDLSVVSADKDGNLFKYNDENGSYNLVGYLGLDDPATDIQDAKVDEKTGLSSGKVEVPLKQVSATETDKKVSEMTSEERFALATQGQETDKQEGKDSEGIEKPASQEATEDNGSAGLINTNLFKGQSMTLYEDLTDNGSEIDEHPKADDEKGKEDQTISIGQPEMKTKALIDLETGHYINAEEVDESKQPSAKPEAKPEQSEAKSDAKSEAKSDAKSEAKSDAKSEAKSDAKSEAKSDAKSEAKSDAKSEAKSDAKSEAKSDAKSEAKSDAKGVKIANPVGTRKMADLISFSNYQAGDTIDATAMARDAKDGSPIVIKEGDKQFILAGRATVTVSDSEGEFVVPLHKVEVSNEVLEKLTNAEGEELAKAIAQYVPVTFSGTQEENDALVGGKEEKPSSETKGSSDVKASKEQVSEQPTAKAVETSESKPAAKSADASAESKVQEILDSVKGSDDPVDKIIASQANMVLHTVKSSESSNVSDDIDKNVKIINEALESQADKATDEQKAKMKELIDILNGLAKKPSTGESADKGETTNGSSNKEDVNKNETSSSDEGSLDIPLSQLRGKTITMYEVLTTPTERGNVENVTVSETDKDNKDQQVRITNPEIQTEMLVNGDKGVQVGDNAKAEDIVRYKDLAPNETVNVNGVLTEDGKVREDDGKFTVGTGQITPEGDNTTVDTVTEGEGKVEFGQTDKKPADELLNPVLKEDGTTTSVDPVKVETGNVKFDHAGDAVAMETVTGGEENEVVAEHKDANDKNQTITVADKPVTPKAQKATPKQQAVAPQQNAPQQEQATPQQNAPQQAKPLAQTGFENKKSENPVVKFIKQLFNL